MPARMTVPSYVRSRRPRNDPSAPAEGVARRGECYLWLKPKVLQTPVCPASLT